MTARSPCIVLPLLLLGATPLVAQSTQPPPTPEARKSGERLLAGLALDPALCGTYRFGEYRGDKNVGQIELVVARAADERAAVYEATLRRSLRLGIHRTEVVERVFLDARLARVRSTSVTQRGDERSLWVIGGKPGAWLLRGEHGGRRGRQEYGGKVADHSALASRLLLARKAPPAAARYDLDGIAWPPPEAFVLSPKFVPADFRLTLTVGGSSTRKVRGREVVARELSFSSDQEYGRGLIVAVGPKGELLGFHDDGGLTTCVAIEGDKALADLPGLEPADLAACRKLVELWIDVGCGRAKPEALRPGVAWGELPGTIGRREKALAGLAPAALERLLLERLAAAANAKVLELLSAEDYKDFVLLERTQEGVAAEFLGRPPGLAPFRLARRGGRWQIVDLPLDPPWALTRVPR